MHTVDDQKSCTTWYTVQTCTNPVNHRGNYLRQLNFVAIHRNETAVQQKPSVRFGDQVNNPSTS